MPKTRSFLMAILLAGAFGTEALGQAMPPSILSIRVENQVEYVQDLSDASKFATDSGGTTVGLSKNFGVVTLIADIVSVNDQPVKGVYVRRTGRVSLRPDPSSGDAIADVARTALREVVFEILKSDGTPIGSIVGLGFSGGLPPPGAPSAQTGGSWAIVGGTGAFLGARGQFGGAQPRGSTNARLASMTEDPSSRRLNGGGTQPFILTVIPMLVPQIASIAGGPEVRHSNDSSGRANRRR
jgi:hypothetical protein